MTLLCACGRPAVVVADISTMTTYQRTPLCARCLGLARRRAAGKLLHSVDVVIDPDMMQMLPDLKGSVCWCGPKGLRVAWCPTHGTLTNPVASPAKTDKDCPRKIKHLHPRRAKS